MEVGYSALAALLGLPEDDGADGPEDTEGDYADCEGVPAFPFCGAGLDFSHLDLRGVLVDGVEDWKPVSGQTDGVVTYEAVALFSQQEESRLSGHAETDWESRCASKDVGVPLTVMGFELN